MVARPLTCLLGLLFLLSGCSVSPPGPAVEKLAELSRFDEADALLASVLKGYLPIREEWGPRSVEDSRESPTWSRTLRLDAQARREIVLPRLEEKLRREGFAVEVSEAAETPPGYFALLEIKIGTAQAYRVELLQEVNARLAVIIDDVGYSRSRSELLVELGLPLTLAILPHTPYAAYWDQAGQVAGFEIILHCPLSAVNPDLALGPGAIQEAMAEEEMKVILGENLSALPHAVGCNNHMGSAFTADTEALTTFLGLLEERGFFFVDSVTVSGTATVAAARSAGIPVARRDVFLDHFNETEQINSHLDRAVALAIRQGSAVAIGHYRPLTLEILARRLPELRQDGIRIVPVSELVKLP